jgi:CBS-domain-containing membrane protein
MAKVKYQSLEAQYDVDYCLFTIMIMRLTGSLHPVSKAVLQHVSLTMEKNQSSKYNFY